MLAPTVAALACLTLALTGCSSGAPDAAHRTSHHRSSSPAHSPTATSSPSPAPGALCDPKFERYTYHPARLHRLANCVTVTGVIVRIKLEADGDAHIQVKLDPQYQNLMNAANRDPNNAITRGYFIVEPDCIAGPVTQADAKGPCATAVAPPGYSLLRTGAHLQISGPWVLDADHGHNEVHPVERVALAP